VVEAAVDRIGRLAGGEVLKGQAIAPDGELKRGSFAVVGPMALFVSEDCAVAGLVGSGGAPTPVKIRGGLGGTMLRRARELVTTGRGELPIAPATGMPGTLRMPGEILARGGPLTIPVLLLGLVSLSVGAGSVPRWRWMRPWSATQIEGAFREVNQRGVHAGSVYARRMGGPVGEMFDAALCHIEQPKRFVEAIMAERVLATRMRLNRLLPVIGLCGSAAPLFGLLGTIVGMIGAFRASACADVCDTRALSAGISDALLVTELGLIVAISSLLLHALLTRRAASLVQNMEMAASVFLNRLPDREEHRAMGHDVRPAGEEAWHAQVSVA
jgi:biopolymer transport protein ExbB